MDEFELENNESRAEEINEVTRELAIDLAWGNITTDNRSPSTNLDALDQIILFELGEYIDDIITLAFLKIKTLLEAEDVLYDSKKKKKILVPRLLIPNKPLSIDINDELLIEQINNIALYNVTQTYLEDIITIDNPSPSNKKNSLEQLVDFHFRDYIQGEKDSQVIVTAIKTRIKLLETGSNLSEFCLDTEDDFIEISF